MYGLDKQRWKQAIQEEIDSINKNSAWKLTIYNHQKSYSWLEVIIHKKNIMPNGEVNTYKPKLVAQGYSQVPGYTSMKPMPPKTSSIYASS